MSLLNWVQRLETGQVRDTKERGDLTEGIVSVVHFEDGDPYSKEYCAAARNWEGTRLTASVGTGPQGYNHKN